LPRVDILGVHVSAIDLPQAVQTITAWIESRQPNYVCVTGVHGVMESQRSQAVRQVHNAAGLVTPDGMPLVWLSRLKGYPNAGRVYGPDLTLAVCAACLPAGCRHFFYGGPPGLADQLAGRLTARFAGLQVAGRYSPPFRPLTPEEDEQVIQAINAANPDIVWVGLSTPRQELWMADHLNRLTAPVMIGVGAAFDFLAGAKKQAPRWMQRSGLEWLYRLASEPRRLWKRYLINNPLFLLLLLAQALGLRKYNPQ
jgi:N-acetylglucosaminyldiphosphoundecaprenol N-acetyl-beta-D-mannosaminyltransferase